MRRLVDCIVSTGGGIEEDFIKCLGPTKIGEMWNWAMLNLSPYVLQAISHWMGSPFGWRASTASVTCSCPTTTMWGTSREKLLPLDHDARVQVMFEEWLTPILDAMVVEQREQGVVWTPSKMIHRMGREIDNPESVYYWCYKNDIPVYSPAITDGSIGDMIFFHSFKTPGLVLDLVQVPCPSPASCLSLE
jgi:deoxyhypusine synthase